MMLVMSDVTVEHLQFISNGEPCREAFTNKKALCRKNDVPKSRGLDQLFFSIVISTSGYSPLDKPVYTLWL